ncbi:MAG TPA: hypothetical protein VHE54_03395 [Puia sp.]|nr:hypothetical protein [Puia sp.]
MAKRIHKYLFYILLSVVYGVFFSVESFYNFEGHSDAKKLFSQSSIVIHSAGSGVVSTSAARFPSAHKIRLNKRYQQENCPPCPVFRVELPVCYVAPRILGVYTYFTLPRVTIDRILLRGPPVTA